MAAEALGRAAGGMSTSNYAAIFSGFASKGIPAADINPRENVFTFNAWRALGRTVKRGEHGVKVVTWINRAADPSATNPKAQRGYKFPRSVTVFHISQTIPLGEVATPATPADAAFVAPHPATDHPADCFG